MRGFVLCLLLFLWPCLYGEETPAKGDLNEDRVVDAVDTVWLANYQVGNLGPLYEAGECYVWDSIVGALRYVPAGTFTQGYGPEDPCPYSEETPFSHTLTKNLAVMQTEVTRRMWADLKARQATLPADPTETDYGAGLENPVQSVTWYKAVLFANLLSVEQGLTRCYYTDAVFTTPLDATNYVTDSVFCDWLADGFRLPTEGEWEYFCRAGTTTPFSVTEPNFITCGEYCNEGDLPGLESVAWYCANMYDPVGNDSTKPVALKDANPWGLYDVHGNVREWCWDWYDSTYPDSPVTDYHGGSDEYYRVLRGGSYIAFSLSCRSAYRYSSSPDSCIPRFGFRLCRSVN